MKIMNIVGARPNFMKIAPLMHEMVAREGIEPVLVHTGQHYDKALSDVFFDELNIPRPDINLGVGSGPREQQIREIQAAFRPVLLQQQPDLLLVVGDVTSTIACSEVARDAGIRIAHVEAGLRSFDRAMPEELNRIETDRISDYLFLTERGAFKNLADENVAGEAHFVGNVMIDSLIANLASAEGRVLEDAQRLQQDYYICTIHRPSNVDSRDALRRMVDVLLHVAEQATVLVPLHPRTRGRLVEFGLLDELSAHAGILLHEPMGYLDFINAVKGAKAVLTDSGGIQEETTYLNVPCITMRENTERPVTLEVGSNVLVGTDIDKIVAALDSVQAGTFKSGQVPELWDGNAAVRIVDILQARLAENGQAAGSSVVEPA